MISQQNTIKYEGALRALKDQYLIYLNELLSTKSDCILNKIEDLKFMAQMLLDSIEPKYYATKNYEGHISWNLSSLCISIINNNFLTKENDINEKKIKFLIEMVQGIK